MNLCGIKCAWITAAVVVAAALLASGCGGKNAPPTKDMASGARLALQSQLAQLEALKVPPGVNEGVFQQLKDALRAQLLSVTPGKAASTPPQGAPNAVNDLGLVEAGGLYTATWSYRNLGDYNQDGVVSVQDITPLAMHFGHSTAAGGTWDELDPVIDGDGSETIGITDVTPLAQHFSSACNHYHVMQSELEAGPYSEIGSAAFGSATGSGRKQFSVGSLALTQDWWYMAQAEDSEDSAGEPGVPVQLTSVNQQPLAAFTADPMSGQAPLTVSFDASGSSDPDGSIAAYKWDWNADGISDESSASPLAEHVFETGGTYEVSLQVVDNLAGSGSVQHTITVNSDWIHSWGQTGWDTSPAVTTNSDGEVFVAAQLDLFTPNQDIALLKYSPQGDLLWQKAWGGSNADTPVGIVTNSYGEIFIVGRCDSYGEGSGDVVLLKYSPLGELQWSFT
jgi:hypothetical protein